VVGWWRYGDIIYRQYPVAAGWGGDGWEQQVYRRAVYEDFVQTWQKEMLLLPDTA
jgi:hypothetical protein